MIYNSKIVVVVLLILLPLLSFAQFSISGKVRSKTLQEPLAGATINIYNTYIVVQSASDGSYELNNLKNGKVIIVASLLGYQKFADTINLDKELKYDIELIESPVLMDEVIVTSTRVDDKSAMAYSNVDKEQIAEQNIGQDLPYLLNQLTSVVTTSDAGAGVGYTGMRIRGSDATRINVTINGIPVNDAESQGTYWVDLPDIASSIDNIQVQRGVGTSTNGAGAFGGSLNIQTTKLNPKPNAEYNTSYSSFNTFKNTVNIGTGLIKEKFAVDTRLSKINSDGFINRASSDLKSYYLSGAYYGKKTIVKFITFSGYEETYQAWNGVPESRLKGDVKEMTDYINRNYLDAEDALNLLNSDSRTYNQFTYKNQVDHYRQDYYQLHFSHEIKRFWNLNLSLHYTKGKGYYEEYRKSDAFANYGLRDVMIGTDTITNTNLVRRRWLDNDFYGTTFSLNYNNKSNFTATLGGAWNQYLGLHYGEIIWVQYSSNGVFGQPYYKDTAKKSDFNIFIKANYSIADNINFFVDVQYRKVDYSFLGFNSKLQNVQQQDALDFINPKFGVNYFFNPNAFIYASYSIGSKEPSRDDYTQSTPESRPKAEKLRDIEFGYKHKTKIAMWSLNYYAMRYKNQLVLTGEVNDVGAYNRTNVENSYRQGIEAESAVQLFKKIIWNVNFTMCESKIEDYYEFIDDYDNGGQIKNIYRKTDIAFSPNYIAASSLVYEPFKNFKLSFISKYVGAQFLDNTSNDNRKLDAFFLNNIRLNYSIKTKFISQMNFTIAVNNLLNKKYESNGYTYSYITNTRVVTENFYYPQAGRNYMVGIGFKF